MYNFTNVSYSLLTFQQILLIGSIKVNIILEMN